MDHASLTNPTESFGDFIRRIRKAKGLSCKDVEKQSARFGKRIAGSYVNRLENSHKIRPTAERLTALANGLGVPIEEVLARAADVVPFGTKSGDELHLITAFRALSKEHKADILKIVDMWHSEEIKTTSALFLSK